MIFEPGLGPLVDDASLNDASLNDAWALRIVDTLDEVPAEPLARLSRDRSFYVGLPWLRTVEALRGGGTAYVVASGTDGMVRGVLPVYWGAPSGRGFYSPFDMFLEPSGGRFRREDWSPACIVGSRTAYDCEFLVDPDLAKDAQDTVLAAMLGAAEQHARSAGAASLGALYLSETGAAQLGRILPPDRPLLLAAANAVLELQGPSFDDYSRGLGRKRATSIRHERRVFAAAGYHVEESRLSESIDDIADLFAALETRHGHEGSPAGEAAEMTLMAERCDDQSLVLAARRSGRIAGAVLVFLHGDTMYVRSAGFDYTMTGTAFEYFNLAYYELIEYALRHGYRRIEYGITAYAAKVARGAVLRPLRGFVSSFGSDIQPGDDAAFVAWNAAREQAVSAGRGSLLRETGLV